MLSIISDLACRLRPYLFPHTLASSQHFARKCLAKGSDQSDSKKEGYTSQDKSPFFRSISTQKSENIQTDAMCLKDCDQSDWNLRFFCLINTFIMTRVPFPLKILAPATLTHTQNELNMASILLLPCDLLVKYVCLAFHGKNRH